MKSRISTFELLIERNDRDGRTGYKGLDGAPFMCGELKELNGWGVGFSTWRRRSGSNLLSKLEMVEHEEAYRNLSFENLQPCRTGHMLNWKRMP